jgi:sulfite dehydrogenase (cytochrome) subunit B
MRWLTISAALALIPALTSAEEKPIGLKQGPGMNIVQGYCGACHSVDYIVMNSPFLDSAKWNAEVAKMINAFGAPIEPADAGTIADYLKQNYGG